MMIMMIMMIIMMMMMIMMIMIMIIKIYMFITNNVITIITSPLSLCSNDISSHLTLNTVTHFSLDIATATIDY
jgi:hypothetical protein